MRHPEHFTLPGYGIVFAAPESSKAHYGLDCPEYLDNDSPDFLREGDAFLGHLFRVYQLTPEFKNMFIVEAEQFSGVYTEMGINEKWITWKS